MASAAEACDGLEPRLPRVRPELRIHDQPVLHRHRPRQRRHLERLLGRDPVLRRLRGDPVPVHVRWLVRRPRPAPGQRLQRSQELGLPHGRAAPARDPPRPDEDRLARYPRQRVLPPDARRRRRLLRRPRRAVLHELLLRLPRELRRLEQRAGDLCDRAVPARDPRLLLGLFPERLRGRHHDQHDQPRAQRGDHRSLRTTAGTRTTRRTTTRTATSAPGTSAHRSAGSETPRTTR